MTTINDAYVNALLADSAYVDGLQPGQTGTALSGRISGRMTPELAKYIGDNFSVVSQVGGLTSSFDATVWRGNAHTPYAGQTYVSMRGTQEAADFVADIDLATTGLAHGQLVDMVNWWLRETTPATQTAKQIALSVGMVQGIPIQNFVAAPEVQGSGNAQSIGVIKSVNGHSLGGYLASAFVHFFGNQQSPIEINTYNSAGFSWPATLNIEHGFSQITQIIGGASGLGGFSSAQNNYYAKNGINVTTNTWDPAGFTQYGTRIGLFQEDLTPGVINNHYMYKLTDALALGNALAQLDSTLDLTKLSTLISAGGNQMVASYEGVLDGLRKLFIGANETPTAPGDVNAGNAGPQPAARLEYHANLKALTDNPAFTALIGKATVALAESTLATKAKTDFGAFLSLNALSPVVISTSDATALNALKQANATLAQQWDDDQILTVAQKKAGQQNFTDVYLLDRQAMLLGLISHNLADKSYATAISGQVNADYTYTDFTSNQVIQFKGKAANASGQEAQQVKFGNDQDNGLVGSDAEAFGLGDRLYGGAGDDYITANAGNDYLEGNIGNDTLKGGEGQDTLLGGTGNDTLDGGAGVDILKGGQGTDIYTLRARDSGIDTITDSDGLGSIKVITADGSETTLGTGTIHKLAGTNNKWESEDKRFTYTTSQESDGSATLLITGAGVTARVEKFSSGNLGITLPDATALETAPAASTVYDMSTKDGFASPQAQRPPQGIETYTQ